MDSPSSKRTRALQSRNHSPQRETRLSNKGQLTEIGGRYTFFWSGHSNEKRCKAGVGFAIKDHLVKKLNSIPEGLNDCLMKLKFPLISTYAPTMTNPDEVKENFYEKLEALNSSVQESDKLILLSDFNARIGPDAIATEVFKSGGSALLTKLPELLKSFCHYETLPQDFKDATIVHMYKTKGNKGSCDNHRGISLLAIASKILARFLLNCFLKHLEQGHLPESQCGFPAGQGTIDMVFVPRQLQEKNMEQHQHLYMTFIALTKAVDTLLYGKLSQGARKVGGQHKRFKDSLKAYLKDLNIDITTWENAASDKPAW
ncbi:hypothetical protein P5673_023686 [Acropora cervicornis]|uniref:Uncharacterized protein n=1 Tax=Acropora cervicornis TaxID=6130 RepID=A0AAD9Q4P9_ACRCE|nr:hypothetical protein P5673_023686 [Acropora cervicornis]